VLDAAPNVHFVLSVTARPPSAHLQVILANNSSACVSGMYRTLHKLYLAQSVAGNGLPFVKHALGYQRAQEQPVNGRDILILAPHTLDCLVLIEISTMDEAVARRDGKGFACCCLMVLPVMAIVLFSLGAAQFTHHQQYRNVATGNLIGMHIDSGRDALGSRYFHLVEEYHIAEKDINCSVANHYDGRADAESDMARHVTGHAQLSLHYHGSNCMTSSDWASHRIEAVSTFIIASVVLTLAACVVPGIQASERTQVEAAERQRLRTVQLTDRAALAASFTSNEAGYTQTSREEPYHSGSSSSEPVQYSQRDRQIYLAGFQEMSRLAQEQLAQWSLDWRGHSPSYLPLATADTAV
jgi:hypothetical protein